MSPLDELERLALRAGGEYDELARAERNAGLNIGRTGYSWPAGTLRTLLRVEILAFDVDAAEGRTITLRFRY